METREINCGTCSVVLGVLIKSEDSTDAEWAAASSGYLCQDCAILEEVV